MVGLAIGAALTLLPAILSVLGERIDAIRVRRVNDAQELDGPWARLARRVGRKICADARSSGASPSHERSPAARASTNGRPAAMV